MKAFRLDAPTDDPLGPDTNHLGVKTWTELPAPGRQDLGLAANLDPAYYPWVHREYVVDYEGHPWIAQDITVLLPLRKTAMASDLDRILG